MANEKNTVVVYVRVLRTMHKKFKAIAAKRGVTVQQVIREILDQAA